MLKKTKIKTTTYFAGMRHDDEINRDTRWLLEVIEDDDTVKYPCYNFVLRCEGVGFYLDMFGLPKEQNTFKEALEVAEWSLDEYKEQFEMELQKDELANELFFLGMDWERKLDR